MKVIENDNLLFVNMPNCVNVFFEFEDCVIIKSKKIADAKAKNAISYYKLSVDMQNKIAAYLCPKAL